MLRKLLLTAGALALPGALVTGGAVQAAEFVDVELTRLDGSTMTRTYEKPRYGGSITMNREILLVSFSNWDPRGGGGPHELANVQITNQRLSQLDWARGASASLHHRSVGGELVVSQRHLNGVQDARRRPLLGKGGCCTGEPRA